jgi:glucokinase
VSNVVTAVPSLDEVVYTDGLRLLADVGATNARFALESAPGRFWAAEVIPVERHDSMEAAARAFLDAHGAPAVRHAAFSLANPIVGDWVKLTNHDWAFSIEAVRRNLKLQTLLVVNDFTALAMSLPRLEAHEVVQVGGGQAQDGGVLGVLGPGTGLGVSGLVPFQDHNVALGTEGGHVTYPPQDADEALAVALAVQRFGHASAERLISGPGLELIYEALAAAQHHAPTRRSAADISAAAQADPPDPVARRALASFCAMLGTVAGNLALTLGCVGGLYIGGGIVPKLLPFFQASAFRERFERKGRFTPWLARIPTFVIAAPRTALRGVSAMLEEHLAAAHGAGRLLEEVRTALHRLSASERQVAQDVLSAPRAWLTDPVVQIAERCNVSTPTVLRFCRSMGFKGLADFKLRLGAGLAGSTQVTHMEVQASDPAVERFGKIFNNSISALVGLRDRLRPEAFEHAVIELAKARRIEIFGSGSSTVAAEDAQHKLGRLGLAAVARTETQLQSLAATFLSAEDVLLVLSDSGAPDPLNDAVARARKAGATVLAMCPQRSELARLADVLLPVDHPEDAAAMVPMVTRLMQTVIIDVLVTDLALQRRDLISRSLALQDDQRFGVLSSHLR